MYFRSRYGTPVIDVSVSLVVVGLQVQVDDVRLDWIQAGQADLQSWEHAPEKEIKILLLYSIVHATSYSIRTCIV